MNDFGDNPWNCPVTSAEALELATNDDDGGEE